MKENPRRILTAVLAAMLFAAPGAARKNRLELRYVGLELPGAPATILPADLDVDGRHDLVVVVALTEWHQIGIEESTEMDDVDGLVEVLTIVPSLIDRRELWVFLATDDGYRPLRAPLELDRDVLSLEIGTPELPILALTDDGISVLRLTGAGAVARAELVPILTETPVLARTGAFVPDLGLAHDLDGDGGRDLLLPTNGGAAVYPSRDGGFAAEPAARLVWPARERRTKTSMARTVPLPEVRDIDGDGLSDLLLRHGRGDWGRFHVLLGAGDGRFEAAVGIGEEEEETESDVENDDDSDSESEDDEEKEFIAHFGDIDGDGVAEYVTQSDLADGDAGMRKGMREAKQPPFRYRLFRMGSDLSRAEEPYGEFRAIGYSFDGGGDDDYGDNEIRLPAGFQDLDGDSRQDLVTLTLDFSLMQAVRILATHRISIGLDFHVWCQGDEGRFRQVKGLDLSGKFRLDLDDLRIGQLSQFAGDFDADGKADFVQMGRGRDVSIHRGREGCFYPPEPDLKVRLKEEPRDLKLVQVKDLDGDGLTDLLVIQPQKITEPGVTPPVRLDLYLSGDGE
ncbi:MAG: VCBS repeat-containing protein [bacterium]|nr:VCBS repeat-containing protein [bacterium]